VRQQVQQQTPSACRAALAASDASNQLCCDKARPIEYNQRSKPLKKLPNLMLSAQRVGKGSKAKRAAAAAKRMMLGCGLQHLTPPYAQ
jgi:hypothetical protein